MGLAILVVRSKEVFGVHAVNVPHETWIANAVNKQLLEPRRVQCGVIAILLYLDWLACRGGKPYSTGSTDHPRRRCWTPEPAYQPKKSTAGGVDQAVDTLAANDRIGPWHDFEPLDR